MVSLRELRDRVETGLGRWGTWVATHSGRVIALVLLATAALGTQLQHFYLDASSEGFFHADDPVRVRIDAFREQFGRDTGIVVGLTPEAGLFDRGFLERLRTFHEEIEDEVPYLVEVTSLINARETIGHAEGLDVGELLEDWPETEEELRAVEARARANELYRNNLISADGRSTLIAIETEAYSVADDFDALEGFGDEAFAEEGDAAAEDEGDGRIPLTGAEDREITAALEAIVERHRSDDLTIHFAGMPVFNSFLSQNMERDMSRFTGLSIALVAFFLALLFRRVGAVVLPLVTVILSVLATLSIMAAAGIPMMPPTQIIPSFLLAVGIGGAVHLLAIFYQARRRGEGKVAAISHALSHSGLAIIMTSLTTAGGLLSFFGAALRPISHFGVFTPIGVIISLFFVLTLLPALIAVFPMRAASVRGDDTISQRMLERVGAFSVRRAPLVLGVWLSLIAVSIVGLFRVQLGHNMLEWFPAEEPVYQATHFLNDHFGGAMSYEMLVDTDSENGLHEPEMLERLQAAQGHLEQFEANGVKGAKVISIVDIVKETHRALNENQPAFYRIPDERKLVAQELLLFENSGSDDVEDLVTSQFETARVTVRVPIQSMAPCIRPTSTRCCRSSSEDPGARGGDATKLTGMMRLLSNTITAALDYDGGKSYIDGARRDHGS